MNRRNFIKNMGCGAMGSTTLLSSLTSLGALNGLTTFNKNAPGEDYKAIVCILFSGGIDSFNMLMPTGTTVNGDNGFSEYLALRTDLAVAQTPASFLALNNPQCSSFRGQTCAYTAFGVHPQMGGVRDLFNAGKLSFTSNIGTLIEPILTPNEYRNSLKKIPLGIYSHSDQIMQWQTSVPQSRDALGVGGRMADLLNANNANNGISMNISLAGKNIFQRGQSVSEYSISDNVDPNNVGLQSFPSWWGNQGLLQEMRTNAIDSLVGQTYSNLLQKTYSATAKESMASFELFKEALKRVPTITTPFPNTSLASDLAAITKVMSVRQQLGTKRQIFFVNYGGWDMHDGLLGGLNSKLPVVSQAMKAFYDSTVELGISENVTTFTISDFARTLTSNGNGSDHAWGGNNMIMGGAVNGGRIFGAYPKMDLSNLNSRNISYRGNFIPTVSTDEMYAELALWYGVSPSDLCYVLPNLGNFYSYSANNYPIGFMNFNQSPISTVNHPLDCLTY
ncbi:DUF1501 domain-containing protein [Lacihabitans sp. CCS-44]|uniref:DUF1501 domain-containing protein n=1 Tax=Lacihabitans sp. CCS-44 TaxID=2487331 RepID=UPI0020CB860B|nr:DUF1501 domain-containing protein [Lacihabitans sp. CCS-44]MCP9755256.1 DUF1501 domain-containing protein [Lacihabitans sp. CCS-44]